MARLPRPAQNFMLAGLARCGDRVQLVGSMGLGKSGACLLHAAVLDWQLGRWPGLVILAPLQVAFNWRREIPQWLPDKRVSLIVGEAAERKAACHASADVYVMTYDNLPWLHDYTGGQSWGCLGSMMLCDESQRIKHTRASWQTSSTGKRWLRTDGGVQTNTLAEHAGDFRYWVNATGSMRPNGLQDVWGQYWYLDGGHALSRSYTAFEQRWFRLPNRHTDFQKPEPLPGAMEEIARLTSHMTVVARTEDFYQIADPIVIDRFTELPAKARQVYSDMRKHLAAQLLDEVQRGVTITAASAAAKNQKLLQIANGFAYWRDEDEDPDLQLCTELHTVKLDMVESILQETGEPLVVVYHYKATLQQLRARFKKRLRELDDKGKTQDDWNAGKVEILALQYKSGSLGLSLQHGGRNICLMTPTYVADDYAQVLERLGPIRQAQSGYNRAVHVFRLHALGTEDSRVFDVAVGKLDAEAEHYAFLQRLLTNG